jgi:2-oxoglutarate ferredoxin oxidoreductase subunit beta
MPNTTQLNQPSPAIYKKDDFVSGQDVRWCPGCGDYSILSVMQRTLAKFDTPRENYAFISGIGCSSRFPYYMNTYGYHTIHGRAPTIASGVKCSNPDLQVWVVTGDGDGLSIGGNHLIHAMRRNMDINILLVNNMIYGLTKGQYSPTSELGKVTKSSPYGSIEHPINALCLAIASEATFVARTLDTDPKHMGMIFERAMAHKGVSFVEIFQNCIIFNDKTHGPVTGRDTREDRMVYLEDGKPLIYGKQKEKAIRIKRLKTDIIDVKDAEEQKIELLIHNEKDSDPTAAYLMTQMRYPEKPVPFGVFRCIEKPTYDAMLDDQIKEVLEAKGEGTLEDLIYTSDTWQVADEGPKKMGAKDEDESELRVPVQDTPDTNPRETIQKVMMSAPIGEVLVGKDIPVLSPSDTVEHIVKVFKDVKIDCAMICEDNKVIGIISQRDLLRKATQAGLDLRRIKANEIMTKKPETVKETDRIAFVVNKMALGGFRHIPVVNEQGAPQGIVSIKDVLSYLDKRD